MQQTTVLVDTAGPAALPARLQALLPDARVIGCPAWQLLAYAPVVEALVCAEAVVDATLLRLAPGLRMVQTLGPSLEQVDLEACARRGVYVANIPWGQRSGAPDVARLVEAGRPETDLYASTLARIVAGNIRRLRRGQAPVFWANPPAWLDAEQARCGRIVAARPETA